MNVELYINTPNDYAQDIGAPVYHQHVAVVCYDEVGEIRHTLNRFNVYAVFLQKAFPDQLTYGMGTYAEGKGSLMAYAPGQIGGKADNGTRRQYHGWVLLFDAELIHGSEMEQRMADYHFFSYNANEALILTDEEKNLLYGLMGGIRTELALHGGEEQTDNILRDYIRLILDYCNRFYMRQFRELTAGDNRLLIRLQQLLTDYYAQGMQKKLGLPSVRYCASQLCLSPGYLGDLVRSGVGESPKEYIQDFVFRKAKELLLGGMPVAMVAEQLGFEYAHHFSRAFKKATSLTPTQYVGQRSGSKESSLADAIKED